MEIKRKVGSSPFQFLVFFSLLFQLNANLSLAAGNYDEVEVGVILDMGSWTGRSIHSCISMAVSDFYASNNHYKTRIVLHNRDSMGDPLRTISAALDLLENVMVKVLLIGPDTEAEGKFLALIGSKFSVPIFSFSSIVSSSGNYPFLVQIIQDETFQFKGITAVVKSYKWKTVNVIYAESDEGGEILSHLFDPLKAANIHIAHRVAISPVSTDDQILNDLRGLYMQPTYSAINLVHMPPSLASRLFRIANGLEMMKEGYAWIITDKTMNLLHMLDSDVIESMHGALGFKAYIPASIRLRDFTLRWRKEFYVQQLPMELFRELDVLGIWAYDASWALAESTERVGVDKVNWGKRLLNEISGSRFTGLSGEFQILNGKLHSETYVILNVLGKGDRGVGFWTPKDGIVKKMKEPLVKPSDRHPSARRGLEAVVWPGGSTTVPKGHGFRLTSGKKLRVGVVTNQFFKELVNVHLDPQTNTSFVTGFCIDVFEAAIKSLDYEVPYEFIPFVDQNGVNLGSYSDLIYQVHLQKYDAAVGDITITANRSLYVDFTMPYTDLGLGTIARRGKNDMWVFLKPLQTNLWLTSAAFFVLLGYVVWTIEHRTNVEFQGSTAHQVGTILWFGFSTLVYAHREKLTSNLSRLVVIVWLFAVLILTSNYTATLSSMLTVQQIQLTSISEYIGVESGYLLGGIISSNLNFKDYRLMPFKSRKDYAEALSSGSKKGGVAGVIDEIPYIKIFLAKFGADYGMVASSPSTNGFGFAFQKGSPMAFDVSRAIMKLREEGKLEMMENAWFRSQSTFMPENAISSMPESLSVGNFGGLFILSLVSFILALVLHLIFMILRKLQSNNITIRLLNGGKLAFMLRLLAARNENVVLPGNVETEEQGLAGSS